MCVCGSFVRVCRCTRACRGVCVSDVCVRGCACVYVRAYVWVCSCVWGVCVGSDCDCVCVPVFRILHRSLVDLLFFRQFHGALVLPLITTASFISDVCSVSLSPLPLHPGDPGCGVRACGGGVRACGGRGSVGSASHFDSLIHQRCLQCLFSSSPPGDPGCGVRASGGRCACVWGVVC